MPANVPLVAQIMVTHSNQAMGASTPGRTGTTAGGGSQQASRAAKRTIKNDETRTPNQKLAIGLKELKYQLAEVEMFFRWYNKIRNMNELSKDKYWKRTHRHIYNVKERLINIATSIKELDQ